MGGSSSTEQQPAPAAETPKAEEKSPAPAAALKQGLAAGTAGVVAAHWKAHKDKEHQAAESAEPPTAAHATLPQPPSPPAATPTNAAAPAAPAAPPAPAAPAAPAAEAVQPGETKPAEKKEDKKEKGKSKDGKGKGKESKEDGKGKKGRDGKKGKGKGGTFEPPTGPTGSGFGFRLNVKSLSDETTADELKTLFGEFGTVHTAQVKTQDSGKSRGYGFVVMSTEEEGKKAQAAMNGREVHGKTMLVLPAERRQGAEGAEVFEQVKSKGKGKGKDGGKGKMDASAAMQQQAVAAAYMQQYQQQYMLFLASYYQQQQQAAGYPYGAAAAAGSAPPAPPPAAVADGSKAPMYEGSLKSLSAKKGYGFIVNMETHKIYERDVYVDKEVLPEGAKVADRLLFTVETNKKGHPRAAKCEFALPQNP